MWEFRYLGKTNPKTDLEGQIDMRALFSVMIQRSQNELTKSTVSTVETLLGREQLGSTDLGNGMALPHTTLNVPTNVSLFSILEPPAIWPGGLGTPISVVGINIYAGDNDPARMRVLLRISDWDIPKIDEVLIEEYISELRRIASQEN